MTEVKLGGIILTVWAIVFLGLGFGVGYLVWHKPYVYQVTITGQTPDIMKQQQLSIPAPICPEGKICSLDKDGHVHVEN